MKICFALFMVCLLAGCAAWRADMRGGSSPQELGQSFESFLIDLEAEAIARGINPAPLRASYGAKRPAPLPEARAAEGRQREFTDTFAVYTTRVVSAARIARGKALLAEHNASLQRAAKAYGVPPELMVALWGIESDFGRQTGSLPLLPTLASMAYKSPRHALFRREVLAALQLPNAARLQGSWAGATGQCQFLPSNVLAHARDGNGDGMVDIWRTEADVFASTANFLRHLGYQKNQPWRWRVTEPLDMAGIEVNERGLSEPLTLAAWRERGLEIQLPLQPDAPLRFYQPAGEDAFMVGPNYEAVLAWNYSSFFASSVFLLADALREPKGRAGR